MMTLTLKMLGLLEGPGAFAKKIREVHGFNVPRNIVYNLMADIDPEGLQSRGGVGQPKKRRRNQRFVSPVSKLCAEKMQHFH